MRRFDLYLFSVAKAQVGLLCNVGQLFFNGKKAVFVVDLFGFRPLDLK